MSASRSALIVASQRYDDEKLRALRAPARDAEELARVLADESIGGFDVEVSVDEPESSVRRKLERFFQNRDRDDLLLLHFSCHGIKDDEGELYFATPDTDTHSLDSTAVSGAFVERQIRRSRSRRIVLLLDCCYSGAFARGSRAKAGGDIDLRERFEGRGRAILTASSAMEYAFEGDDVTGDGNPSVFTESLVHALASGEADHDEDGLISVDELYDHIYEQVRERTPKQTPRKWSDVEGQLIIARSVRPIVVTPADLPREVRDALAHPLTDVREGAVRTLSRLAAGGDARMALAVQQALEPMRDDDSRRVSDLAASVLLTLPATDPASVAPVDSEDSPKLAPEPVRKTKKAPPVTTRPPDMEPQLRNELKPEAAEPDLAGSSPNAPSLPTRAAQAPDATSTSGDERRTRTSESPASIASSSEPAPRTDRLTKALRLMVVGAAVNLIAASAASVESLVPVARIGALWWSFEAIIAPVCAAVALFVAAYRARRGLALGIALGLTLQTSVEFLTPLVAGRARPLHPTLGGGAVLVAFGGSLLMLAAVVLVMRSTARSEATEPLTAGRRRTWAALVMLTAAAAVVGALFLHYFQYDSVSWSWASIYELNHWLLLEPFVAAAGLGVAALALVSRRPDARLWGGIGAGFAFQDVSVLPPVCHTRAERLLPIPGPGCRSGSWPRCSPLEHWISAVADRADFAVVEPGPAECSGRPFSSAVSAPSSACLASRSQ